MKALDRQFVISIKTILIGIAIVLSLYVLYELRSIFGILFVAALIVISMEGAVKRLMKLTFMNKPLSRTAAVLIGYAFVLLVLIFALVTAIPMALNESQRLVENFSFFLSSVEVNGRNLFDSLRFLDVLVDMAHGGRAMTVLRDSVSVVTKVFTLLVLSIYMSLDWENIKSGLINLFPSDLKSEVREMIARIEVRVGSWIKGQLLVMLIIGFMSFLGLIIIGVPYALALGMISGVLEIVPILGPFFAAIIATAVGFSHSPTKGLIVLAYFIVIQQLESNYITPQVMKKQSGYSPLVILIALMIGHSFFGIPGAILAIPVSMLIGIFVEKYTPFLDSKDSGKDSK